MFLLLESQFPCWNHTSYILQLHFHFWTKVEKWYPWVTLVRNPLSTTCPGSNRTSCKIVWCDLFSTLLCHFIHLDSLSFVTDGLSCQVPRLNIHFSTWALAHIWLNINKWDILFQIIKNYFQKQLRHRIWNFSINRWCNYHSSFWLIVRRNNDC